MVEIQSPELPQEVLRLTPIGIYMFKVNNGSTRTICEICSKLAIKTPERYGHHSGVFVVKLEQILHIV